MDVLEYQALEDIARDKPWLASKLLKEYLKIVEIREYPDDEPVKKQRTLTQNGAIHLYLEWLATELNLAGFDMKKVLKQEVDIEWSKEMTKRYLWHPVQEALFGTTSTADLDKHQVGKVYEHINRLISEKTGIHVPFPSEEGKNNVRLQAMENLKKEDYPEYNGAPKF